MLRLLLVEDSRDIRPRMVRWLSEIDGVSLVATAETIVDTGRLVQTTQPDLLILDLSLADGNAMASIGHFKALAPDMEIAVHTNDTRDLTRHKCLEEGARWFFDKSGEPEDLLDFVQSRAHRGLDTVR